jgi:diaminopimelate decarboxylase
LQFLGNLCEGGVVNKKYLSPEVWGLEVSTEGELVAGGCSTVSLADIYGTPLHVVDENKLRTTAVDFVQTFKKCYPGAVSVHYAFKCNSVPGVVNIVRQAGLKAEVMSEFEVKLALQVGFRGDDIIINGPYKPQSLLRLCLDKNVRFVVIDSLAEMKKLDQTCKAVGKKAYILFRINPDFVPRGMNQGTATGSRKGCAFGLDLRGGEVEHAFEELEKYERIHFDGFQMHIGTGIRDPNDYRKVLERLKSLVRQTKKRGYEIRVLDIGGGFAAITTREMTTREMLIYQGWERLPTGIRSRDTFTFQDFAEAVTAGVSRIFEPGDLPELLIEPGRSIASSSQFLLLRVHGIKKRPGIKKWLLTDGGVGTVTTPTYYEYHEVFLCDDVKRRRTENVTIIGPVCFAGDIVYRNKRMPAVYPGEVLAVMDSGAYFTAWESSFGFPRPAIVVVKNGKHRLIRQRETFNNMISRDYFDR